MLRWFGLALAALVVAAVPAGAPDPLDAAAAALDRATAQPKAEATALERMAAILKGAPDALRAKVRDSRGRAPAVSGRVQ